jgi:uncharacterized membrane protein YczE
MRRVVMAATLAQVDLYSKANLGDAARMMIRRLIQLYLGLALYGLAVALVVRADLGLDPWDVFHQGLARLTGLSFGLVLCLVGAAVLLLWIPLRQWPGLGTLSNVVVIGMVADVCLNAIPQPQSLVARGLFLLAGIALHGVACGAYIGAGLGPGPRDGVMTGLVRRTGWKVRHVRTGIELAVLAVGWALGGTVGVGTVLFAVAIGPLVHVFLPMFTIRENPVQAAVSAAL